MAASEHSTSVQKFFVACGSVECFFGSGVDSQRYSAVLLTETEG